MNGVNYLVYNIKKEILFSNKHHEEKIMSKAINWPAKFYDEVTKEDVNVEKIALRLGSLYFDNDYYQEGEIVNIRVDSKIVRDAVISTKMQLMKIKDLTEDLLFKNKKDLQAKSKVVSFLSKNYKESVDDDTEVTVIFYKNLSNLNTEESDDPHM